MHFTTTMQRWHHDGESRSSRCNHHLHRTRLEARSLQHSLLLLSKEVCQERASSLFFFGAGSWHPYHPQLGCLLTAFCSTSETLRYQTRWLSDSKWHKLLVKEHYFGNGKQDQAEELKFSTTSLVLATATIIIIFFYYTIASRPFSKISCEKKNYCGTTASTITPFP